MVKKKISDGTKILLVTTLAAIFVITLGALVAKNKDLTWLESSLIQIIQLSVASYVAFTLAKEATIKQQSKLVTQRAILSMRRSWRQADSITKLASTIEKQRTFLHDNANGRKQVDINLVENSLEVISDQVVQQGGVVNDIILDWKEMAPEEISELKDNTEEN